MSQMASVFKLLSFLLFLTMVFEAEGNCSLSDISIDQRKTASWAHGMPVWSVTISNKCECSQADLRLNCTGFQTYFEPDPSKLTTDGVQCIVKRGAPISHTEPIHFLYAWDPKFNFQPISSKIQC